MKKEISDHLANTFFGAKASVKKKENKSFVFYVITSSVLLAFVIFGSTLLSKYPVVTFKSGSERLRLERHDGPYSLKFDFVNKSSSAAALDIELPDVDLKDYAKLGFTVRFRNSDNNKLSKIKLTLVDQRRETSSQYVSEINSSWKKIVVPLAGFDKFHNLSGHVVLSFMLEPWNISVNKGELLIDDIQFLRN